MVLNVQFRWHTAAVEIKCESRLHLTLGLVVTYLIILSVDCRPLKLILNTLYNVICEVQIIKKRFDWLAKAC